MSSFEISAPHGRLGFLLVSLRSLLAHKLRLLAMVVSIVLGVGLLTGTYVLGDDFHTTFQNIFGTATKHFSLAVRSQAVGASNSATAPRTAVPASLLSQIAKLPDVERAEGSVLGYAQFLQHGHLVGSFGSPNVGMSVGSQTSLGSMVVVAGHFPDGPDQVVMDAATYANHHFVLGQRVRIAFRGQAETFRLVGVVDLGGSRYLAGATIAGFDLPTAESVMGIPGSFSEIDVTAKPGVPLPRVEREVQAAVGSAYQVVTASQLASSTAADLQNGLAFIPWTLAVFAFVSLFLGALIVFNTFSLVAAQRSWEIALYRCLGASPRQIMATVVGEASLVGLVSCLLGVGWGVLAAGTILPKLAALGGILLPSTVTTVVARTVLVPIAAGMGATVIASSVPALRAARLTPVAALRGDAEVGSEGFSRRRVAISALLFAGGAALLLIGPEATSTVGRLVPVVAGALLVLFAVALGSPMLVAPLAGLIGAPLERYLGMPGMLARRNALRNPRRTAGTAAALMIGLALISIVAILASSVRASVASGVEGAVRADLVLVTPDVQPFSPSAIPRISLLPQVQEVAAASMGTLYMDGGLKHIYGVDPMAWDRLVRTTTISGNLTAISQGGFATAASVASAHGWHVGQVVSLDLSSSGAVSLPLVAIYADNFVDGDFLVSTQTLQQDTPDQGVIFALVRLRPGVPVANARAAILSSLSDTPQVQVLDRQQFRNYVNGDVDLLMALLTALVAQAVAVALFGIVNSLSLSVFERTREIGLLRAIGSSRRQIRLAIYWESLVVVSLGCLLGLVVGVLCSWGAARSLVPLGVTSFSVPFVLLALFLAAAMLGGIAASLWPAVRATRIDVLRALAVTG